jgi:hypothetical protein
MARYHPDQFAELKRHEAERQVLTEAAEAERAIVEAVINDDWGGLSFSAETSLRAALTLGVIPYVQPPDDKLKVYYRLKLTPSLRQALLDDEAEIVKALTRQMEIQHARAHIVKNDRTSTFSPVSRNA